MDETKQQHSLEQEEDWWRQAENADEVAHFRGGTALSRLSRTNKNTPSTNTNPPTSQPSTQEVDDGKPRYGYGIYDRLKQLLGKTRQSHKKLFWGLMVMISWRTIYELDLEQYTNAEEVESTHKISSVPHEIRMKSIEDEITSLSEITDDLLTSTLNKSSNVGGSEHSASLTKQANINTMSQIDETLLFRSKQTPGNLAESVRFGGGDEFIDSHHNDPSLSAALRHFSSPLHGKETIRPISNGFNSQNHMSNYLNNPISMSNGNSVNEAHGAAAALACSNYGGPFKPSESADLVYWRDIPSDATFVSPFYNPQAQEATTGSIWKAKYLTFEMDVSYFMRIRLRSD